MTLNVHPIKIYKSDFKYFFVDMVSIYKNRWKKIDYSICNFVRFVKFYVCFDVTNFKHSFLLQELGTEVNE
jgi:hypothetical protein